MTYKFKVGDKGFIRSGKPYEVIFAGGENLIAQIEGRERAYPIDGCGYFNPAADMMPPGTRPDVWVVLYLKSKSGEFAADVFDREVTVDQHGLVNGKIVKVFHEKVAFSAE